MRIGAAVVSGAATAQLITARQPIRLPMLAAQIQKNAAGTHLVIGVTPTCPYGLAACWAGAYHALKNLEGVADVGPIPNAEDSTADVYLKTLGLPDLARWPQQFTHIASGSQKFRGVEVSLDGDVVLASSQLILPATADHPIISLSPLDPTEIVQLDLATRRPRAATPAELDAYDQLRQRVVAARGTLSNVKVTGPLYQLGNEYGMFARSIT